MTRVVKDPNAYRATHHEGLFFFDSFLICLLIFHRI